MKNITTLILLCLSLSASSQVSIKAGVNYSGYTGHPLGGPKFSSYYGAAYKLGHIVLDAKVTTKGSKSPGRYWIYETNQLNTTYLQTSIGYQFRPCFHLSVTVAPYYAYMLKATTAKWNYSAWDWNINYMRRNEWGGELWFTYHFGDQYGGDNIFSIQCGVSMQGNRMADDGFEMRELRNCVGSVGIGVKIF